MYGAHYQHSETKQVKFDESQLSCSNVKQELRKDVDFENRRVNVDSAKKLAVLQHMDYDGFRQMVLGANLKPIKKGAATEIYNPQGMQAAGNINPIAYYDKLNNFQSQIGYNEEVVKRTLELTASDELTFPQTSEIFEKFLCKKLKDSLQRYTYMRLIDPSHYE